ncbi:Lipopolysaccharide biosynthesis regulator YciM, contains six TPR domains and a predicted metal-binding C-terminal domain [Neorhodopirellula lusitana]|uniref:Lipopolysaccharide biosynthesis regulator YciM, contains six TPR domains and a predicted metal-binding C-terminal domain n=1 Tax=Neorhodopirellula lusitana TaxID=445327 RepID=A0ABY1QTM8_9BACT|nr:tetratricopeptide repeat protein [Neorhodopirellula lusitana]SMP78479.1 Lipopolysaccharide biosynthesis regulator YciM, contains six TPR domains and a predicted metal-binding C-terminal domain [Neorhodopirellula lusitana]
MFDMRSIAAICASLCGAIVFVASVQSADLQTAESLFRSGKYEEAEGIAKSEVEAGTWNESWPRLLLRLQLTQGKYAEALTTYEDAISRYPSSLTLRLNGIEALRHNNLIERSDVEITRFFTALQSSTRRYVSRDNLVAAGRYFTERGEDARKVLEMFYDRIRDADPDFLEAYIATAELAIAKGDYQVAAETVTAAERVDATDPRTAYLAARALESSDPKKANEAIERALGLNPHHIPSLIFQAEAAIDREQYDGAIERLNQVIAINPKHPEAWALRAVLAHLDGNMDLEKEHRETALATWSKNPKVDYLIGKKLSEKYRFAEGAAYQKQAIAMDPDYHVARFQLAQDQLRLGKEEDGWKLAQSVSDADPYNVVAHNLVTLYDRIKTFETLQSGDIHVRMQPREARLYGDEVLNLLGEACEVLCAKYDVEPDAPILVEIFPDQKDFAIRTFGLPGGAGYLGVCFGRVITANSPASQGERPSNWQSVLWHEFCHVVTLEKTRNRMPRWLSEGISVHEERTQNPAWGQSMSPLYREMILGTAETPSSLTPPSQLSSAFLAPPSAMHLQFAYYESSLVVQFIIEKHGIDQLKQILDSLGAGLSTEDAFIGAIGPMEKLDSEFERYAKELANHFGPDADWSREGLPEKGSIDEWQAWVDEHPDNVWALQSLASQMVQSKRYEDAIKPLETLEELSVFTGNRGGPMEMLAMAYQQTGDTEKEKQILLKIIQQSSDALPALERLIEMELREENWESVASYAEEVLAIQPLLPLGHESLAKAAEAIDAPARVIRPLQALLALDPIDPAGLNYRLAKSLDNAGQKELAKRHALMALEDAPRFRNALGLLKDLVSEDTAEDTTKDSGEDPEEDAGEDSAGDDPVANPVSPETQNPTTN